MCVFVHDNFFFFGFNFGKIKLLSKSGIRCRTTKYVKFYRATEFEIILFGLREYNRQKKSNMHV